MPWWDGPTSLLAMTSTCKTFISNINRKLFIYFCILCLRQCTIFVSQSWAGEIELAALAEIYHRRIEVYHYHSNQVGLKSFGHSSSGEPSILLAYSDGNHYDSIMTKDFRNNSAICQCKHFHLRYCMYTIPLLQPFCTSYFLNLFCNCLYQIVRIFKCTLDCRRIIRQIQA